ncbi:MAG: ROK family protein [Candidatus Stahlbacteria bacterium]|nr:ROK family protein [Candidatus Stahlbacteria bacterium]
MSKIIGIDVGGTYIKSGILEIPKQSGVITPPEVREFNSLPTTSDTLISCILKLISNSNVDAAGIGVPGLVHRGIIHSSPNLPGTSNLDILGKLSTELKIPITVENDANMYACGEWQYGAGKEVHNLLLLTLGTGVGGGLILDDKLYTGTGFAGEVGHIIIDANGPPCSCGSYGCLESYVSSYALIQRAVQGIKIGLNTLLSTYKTLTPELISAEAYKGDDFACGLITSMGYYLGIAIAGLCNVLAPEIVVIGGGIAKAGDILFNSLRKEVARRLYHRAEIPIVPSALGDLSGILGSAYYVTSHLDLIPSPSRGKNQIPT